MLFWWLFRTYARLVEPRIWLVWALLVVIGTTSGLFHATLSFAGQILDELSILWLMLGGLALFTSRAEIPPIFDSKQSWRLFLFGVGALLSLLGFLQPKLNALLLFVGVLPISCVVVRALLRGHANGEPFEARVWRVAYACIFFWFTAIACWTADRAFCEFWSSHDFMAYPQWHAVWHLLVLCASYLVLVLGAFFLACEQAPQLRPRISLWPRKSWLNGGFTIGVPFVELHEVEQVTQPEAPLAPHSPPRAHVE